MFNLSTFPSWAGGKSALSTTATPTVGYNQTALCQNFTSS